jgi:hypothetical protein
MSMKENALSPVVNELVFFSTLNGILFYKLAQVETVAGVSPDVTIRDFLNWGQQPPAGAVIHSTSWRFDEETGGYVLTWAVTPDTLEGTRKTVVPLTVHQGDNSVYPCVTSSASEHAVAHAARHLSYLLHTDPVVKHSLHHQLGLHDALLGYNPNVAGNPH